VRARDIEPAGYLVHVPVGSVERFAHEPRLEAPCGLLEGEPILAVALRNS